MKTFVDNAGKTWTVVVNVNTIKRIRSMTGFDPLQIVEGEVFDKLLRDPVLLCDVLFVACKPEADEKGITDEEFGRAMYGDAIDHATKVFLEELVDFSPNPRDRANLGKIMQTTHRAMDMARDIVERRLESISDEKIESALQSAIDGYGNAPESSGLIPDHSPSPS